MNGYQRKRPHITEAQLSEATFGERLLEARRIKGETIEEVSNQLRIRPSIILAMETSNFSHMPHKGYARNMISSYARYLGLDSTRITEQFLKEFRRWESTGKPGSSNASSLTLVSKRNAEPSEPVVSRERKSEGRELITAGKRNEYRSTVFGNDTRKETDKRFRQQLRQNQDDQGVRLSNASKRAPNRRPGTESNTNSSNRLRPNDYTGKPPRKTVFSGVSQNLSSRPIMMVIGLVVVFVAILILWAFLASRCSSNDSSFVPVTGVTAEDEGLNEDQASMSMADLEAKIEEDNRYGPFELVVEVAEGDSWVSIDVDGVMVHNEVLESGWKGTFTVTSSASISAGRPGFVTVFKNGIEVPLDTSSGLGILELKVEVRPIVHNLQGQEEAAEN